jgi:hypothetical protein
MRSKSVQIRKSKPLRPKSNPPYWPPTSPTQSLSSATLTRISGLKSQPHHSRTPLHRRDQGLFQASTQPLLKPLNQPPFIPRIASRHPLEVRFQLRHRHFRRFRHRCPAECRRHSLHRLSQTSYRSMIHPHRHSLRHRHSFRHLPPFSHPHSFRYLHPFSHPHSFRYLHPFSHPHSFRYLRPFSHLHSMQQCHPLRSIRTKLRNLPLTICL